MKRAAPLFERFPLLNLIGPVEELLQAELTPGKTNLPYPIALNFDWSKENGSNKELSKLTTIFLESRS